MRLVISSLALSIAFLTSAAAAQQDDKAATKKRILEAIEKKLKVEEERILAEIEKVIDEELAKLPKGLKPSKHQPKEETPKAETPKKEEGRAPKKARGRLGIEPRDVTPEEASKLGIKGGVAIQRVLPGTAAEKGGLKADDILLELDGQPVDSATLPDLVARKGAGTQVTFKVLRGGEKVDVAVTLGRHIEDEEQGAVPDKARSGDELRERIKKFLDKEKQEGARKPRREERGDEEDGGLGLGGEDLMEQLRALMEQFGGEEGSSLLDQLREMLGKDMPELGEEGPGALLKKLFQRPGEESPETPKQAPAGSAWLGVMVEEPTDDLRAQLDLEGDTGLTVADVVAESPAAKILKKGDIIIAFNGTPLKGEAGLRKFMAGVKPGQEIEVTYLRKGKSATSKVTLAARKD